MNQTLNDYLKSKSINIDVRIKKAIAAAVGIPNFESTQAMSDELLRRLQVAELATQFGTKQSFKVEFAFGDRPAMEFADLSVAEGQANVMALPANGKPGETSRIFRVITITHIEKDVVGKMPE